MKMLTQNFELLLLRHFFQSLSSEGAELFSLVAAVVLWRLFIVFRNRCAMTSVKRMVSGREPQHHHCKPYKERSIIQHGAATANVVSVI